MEQPEEIAMELDNTLLFWTHHFFHYCARFLAV